MANVSMKFETLSMRMVFPVRNSKIIFVWLEMGEFSSAMSNPNGSLSQKLCHYHINQGRTWNDILMRPAHRMTYFDLSETNLVQA